VLAKRLSRSTRTPPVMNNVLFTAPLACVVMPVLFCQPMTFRGSSRVVVFFPAGAINCGVSDTARSVECSADIVIVRCVGSMLRRFRTLLARIVARSACPCAARNAESATRGIGVKLDSTFARRYPSTPATSECVHRSFCAIVAVVPTVYSRTDCGGVFCVAYPPGGGVGRVMSGLVVLPASWTKNLAVPLSVVRSPTRRALALASKSRL
jgi:hypothetical protein